MFLTELFEDINSITTLVVYPGRFQPFHKGHRAVYDYLVKKFGRDHVYIATSNKVEPPKSPFNFSDKVKFIALTGVPLDRVVESTQPYRALEITEKYNPDTTRLIFAVSQKDMEEDPRFKTWVKKDGTPTYFQPMPDNQNNMQTLNKHGYIMVVPTFPFTILGEPMVGATQIRAKFANSDPDTQKAIVQDLFGKFDSEVLQILQTKLTQ